METEEITVRGEFHALVERPWCWSLIAAEDEWDPEIIRGYD